MLIDVLLFELGALLYLVGRLQWLYPAWLLRMDDVLIGVSKVTIVNRVVRVFFLVLLLVNSCRLAQPGSHIIHLIIA